MRLNLLLDRAQEKDEWVEKDDAIENKDQLAQPIEMNLAGFDGTSLRLRVDNPVELVYFQGPHYGDRYGIACAALSALAKHGVTVLAVVCAGASVYMITPKGMACTARNALIGAFSIPETVTASSNS